MIIEYRLYFKVDDSTRHGFEPRGTGPLQPFEEESAMGYYEVRADVAEDVTQLEQ
jgi:TfoX/Sxy family transcriptional regulator of competence genes